MFKKSKEKPSSSSKPSAKPSEEVAFPPEVDSPKPTGPVVEEKGKRKAASAAKPPALPKGKAKPTTKKTTPKKATTKAVAKKKGRTSAFSGKKIWIIRESLGGTTNPRREGTFGFKSFEIVRGAGSGKLSYEAYLEKGGRRRDLDWDVTYGYVVVSEKKPTAAEVAKAVKLSPRKKKEGAKKEGAAK